MNTLYNYLFDSSASAVEPAPVYPTLIHLERRIHGEDWCILEKEKDFVKENERKRGGRERLQLMLSSQQE